MDCPGAVEQPRASSCHRRDHNTLSAAVPGSCLCGAVAFEVQGRIHLMSHCHCAMCRKFSGSAFLTFARASRAGFAWTRGHDRVQAYRSSPGAVRCFCGDCGSPLPIVRPGLANVLIPAGTLDADPGTRPALHLFAADRASWFEITDGLPQCDSWPLEFDIEVVDGADIPHQIEIMPLDVESADCPPQAHSTDALQPCARLDTSSPAPHPFQQPNRNKGDPH